MTFTLGTIILTAGFVLVVAALLYMFFAYLPNWNPGRGKVEEDLQRMKKAITPLADQLVPISKQELELFSYAQINQVVQKRITYSSSGVFTNIYHEPLVAYSFKKYISNQLNAVLYVRSKTQEFVYRFKKGEIKVVIDGEVKGALRSNGVLYGGPQNRMIARVNEASDGLIPILVGAHKVGNVVQSLPSKNKKEPIADRAFEFVKADLKDEEKELLLSLGILEMLKPQLEL